MKFCNPHHDYKSLFQDLKVFSSSSSPKIKNCPQLKSLCVHAKTEIISIVIMPIRQALWQFEHRLVVGKGTITILELIKTFSTDQIIFLPPAYVVRREGNVFTGVYLSVHKVGGGVTPWSLVRGSFPGPRSFPRGASSPVTGPAQGRGTPFLAGGGGYPNLGWGTTRQDGGYPTPLSRIVSDAMPWVVRLLRSRRRTVLFPGIWR